jgi:hypothetical protein
MVRKLNILDVRFLLLINKDLIFTIILDLVVAYDDFGIAAACRAYYMFSAFNHKNVFILNGGYNKWK